MGCVGVYLQTKLSQKWNEYRISSHRFCPCSLLNLKFLDWLCDYVAHVLRKLPRHGVWLIQFTIAKQICMLRILRMPPVQEVVVETNNLYIPFSLLINGGLGCLSESEKEVPRALTWAYMRFTNSPPFSLPITSKVARTEMCCKRATNSSNILLNCSSDNLTPILSSSISE
jgi:hypothetical protein